MDWRTLNDDTTALACSRCGSSASLNTFVNTALYPKLAPPRWSVRCGPCRSQGLRTGQRHFSGPGAFDAHITRTRPFFKRR